MRESFKVNEKDLSWLPFRSFSKQVDYSQGWIYEKIIQIKCDYLSNDGYFRVKNVRVSRIVRVYRVVFIYQPISYSIPFKQRLKCNHHPEK